MVDVWRPDEENSRYMNDPSFLEERFGVESTAALLREDALGIARFVVLPSFEGEAVYTVIYRPKRVDILWSTAADSLWASLHTGKWTTPKQNYHSAQLNQLPPPLQQWSSLKEVARAAPSVCVAIISGRSYVTMDGVCFRHTIHDREETIEALWQNPKAEASNHQPQMVLVNAYDSIISQLPKTA